MHFNKYIPNLITISRIIMSVIFVFAIFKQFIYQQDSVLNIIILFIGICISDLLDGKLARKMNCTSSLGAKLDVFSDLFYIIITYVVLTKIKFLPIWFLGFVIFKFSEFVTTSKFIKENNKLLDNPFVFDKIGRIVSATFFIIPGIICIAHCFKFDCGILLINYFLLVICLGGIYSSYLRIKSCLLVYKLHSKC